MPKVYAARCADYDYHRVFETVAKGIEAIGGIDHLLKGKNRIAVKPNLLKAHSPQDCVTTHPAVVQSILQLITDSGRLATVVESPSGSFTARNLETIYETTGIAQAAANAKAALNDDYDAEQVFLEHGQAVKTMPIITAILRADSVVSVAKLKTHTMMTYTGAVKNLFGVVPGLSKAESHFRLPDREDFARMIVDIAEYVRPDISIIDAVWGMEGDGPSSGDKRHVGAMIVSDSPYAADIVAGRIIGLDWRDNPIIKCAVERGLCCPDEIEVVGDDLKTLAVADFSMPKTYRATILKNKVPDFLEKVLIRYLVLYPKFNRSKCVGCGVCVKSCPNGALSMKNGKPLLDRRQCINCFCCHELCPKQAVDIYRPFALKAASRLFN